MARRSVHTFAAATVLALLASGCAPERPPRVVTNTGLDLAEQHRALGETPPNPRPGACYAKVVRPAQFRVVNENITVSEGGRREVRTPARYETVTEQVLVQEETTRVVEVPPTYRIEERTVVVQPEVERVRVIPAQFRTIRETVWIAPDGSQHQSAPRVQSFTRERVQTRGPQRVRKHHTQVQPTDRVVATDGQYRIVIEPPQYGYRRVPTTVTAPGWRRETITRRELVRPEETETYIVPEVTRVVREQVIDQPARTETVVVPPRYETRTRRVLVQPEQVTVVDGPPETQTVTRREQIAPATVVWAETVCEGAAREPIIRAAQRALFERGYYTGAIDGTYNVNFDDALRRFQADNELATGAFTLETARALGVAT